MYIFVISHLFENFLLFIKKKGKIIALNYFLPLILFLLNCQLLEVLDIRFIGEILWNNSMKQDYSGSDRHGYLIGIGCDDRDLTKAAIQAINSIQNQ
ncbi:hypothetical protein J2Y03_004607 [Neobacillus niacini]|uniref:hypothetical protein n=1 Tax=Neobacillus niacini TaxID=86668 RepID=UPI002860043B|nr:hypothetical protein [Neobacillus niacini]MDR7079549.1 hypothetical protein [Neobacillus niacini]